MSRIERPKGCQRYNERKDFSVIEEPSLFVEHVPAPDKYDKVPFDVYQKRITRSIKIKDYKLPRAEPIQKTLDPSPTSYDPLNATVRTQWVKTKVPIGKDASSRCLFSDIAKSHAYKPGPGSHPLADKA